MINNTTNTSRISMISIFLRETKYGSAPAQRRSDKRESVRNLRHTERQHITAELCADAASSNVIDPVVEDAATNLVWKAEELWDISEDVETSYIHAANLREAAYELEGAAFMIDGLPYHEAVFMLEGLAARCSEYNMAYGVLYSALHRLQRGTVDYTVTSEGGISRAMSARLSGASWEALLPSLMHNFADKVCENIQNERDAVAFIPDNVEGWDEDGNLGDKASLWGWDD